MGVDWWPMGLGMAFSTLLPLIVIVLVVWLVVRALPRRDGGGDSAEEVLRRRFASGEIDADEYQRRLEVLRKH
ncbi:MAG TPA: SHOCT domain-containing protein [Candidatus Limnocylindria bacterium]|nr:SHOCT domain-containing protein [Candidatus Limnocylindria bacterium]